MVKNEKTETKAVPAIGREQIAQAREVLGRYRAGKSPTDLRVLDNRRFMNARIKGRPTKEGEAPRVVSAWLFNCIENKLADMMDNFPEPNVLPREESDRDEARSLSSIIPVVLDSCDFEETYRAGCSEKLRCGTAVYGVFWDARKAGGLGDVDVRLVGLPNFFAEPGVTDLQASRSVFTVEYIDRDLLKEEYPALGDAERASGAFQDAGAGSSEDKAEVVSWYYKKRQNGRQVLHFCKFTGDTVLYATENETEPVRAPDGSVIAPAPAESGLYDHGLYPFVVDSFIECGEGIWGAGLIDLGRSAQEWIDRGNSALLKSMTVNAGPRFFVKANAEINKEEFADLRNDIVTFTGSDPASSVMPIVAQPVSGVYLSILQSKIGELKETTGNRDVTSGGAPAGVTAASAIAAMQEAAGKNSRTINKQTYRAYKKIVLFIIELIRQFYDVPRRFRITGRRADLYAGGETPPDGYSFISYTNAGLKNGIENGYRLPQLDVEVTAQKQSVYSKMSQNEFALQLYSAGFFAPAMKEAALKALEMMDFERKEFVVDLVAQGVGETDDAQAAPFAGAGGRAVPGVRRQDETRLMRTVRQKVREAPSPK